MKPTFLLADVHHHDDVGVDELSISVQSLDSVSDLEVSNELSRAVVQHSLGLGVNARVLDVRFSIREHTKPSASIPEYSKLFPSFLKTYD